VNRLAANWITAETQGSFIDTKQTQGTGKAFKTIEISLSQGHKNLPPKIYGSSQNIWGARRMTRRKCNTEDGKY
jgi:hypothetical protein